MIGRPEWFKYRIFGWGLAPKTWHGWVYLSAIALVIGFITALAVSDTVKLWIYVILLGVFIIDIIHIMTQLSKVHDERENYHQLVIERNCSFAAIATLFGIALYQTYQNRVILKTQVTTLPFDYSILAVIIVMVAVKVISTAYVKMKK